MDHVSPVKEIPFNESTIEMIDETVVNFINDQLNIHVNTNTGWRKVPVIWTSAERAFQVKSDKELRDNNGVLIYPLISIARTGFKKDHTKRGAIVANIPEINDEKGGSSITIARRINQDKTSNFANANMKRRGFGINYPSKNKKIVYETITIPVPVYVDCTYVITLKSEYEQHLNTMLTPFINATVPKGTRFIRLASPHGPKYEGFIDENINISSNKESLNADEKMHEAKITFNVLGHLIGDEKNMEKPKVVIRENWVEIRFPRRGTMFGDIPQHTDKPFMPDPD